jgi:formyl-CoA transferase/CoA:oxalate CoA-transferase
MSPLDELAKALELPALASYAAEAWNFGAREEIARLIEPAVRARTSAAWLERLVPLGIWAAPVLTHAETFADPAVEAADAVEEIHHPVAGPVKLLRHPLEFSTGRVEVRRMPPMSGEHTDEILRETGYADTEIAALRQEGAV